MENDNRIQQFDLSTGLLSPQLCLFISWNINKANQRPKPKIEFLVWTVVRVFILKSGVEKKSGTGRVLCDARCVLWGNNCVTECHFFLLLFLMFQNYQNWFNEIHVVSLKYLFDWTNMPNYIFRSNASRGSGGRLFCLLSTFSFVSFDTNGPIVLQSVTPWYLIDMWELLARKKRSGGPLRMNWDWEWNQLCIFLSTQIYNYHNVTNCSNPSWYGL